MDNLDLKLIEFLSNIENVIYITTLIFVIITIIESLELLSLKRYYGKNGIWSDEIIDLKFKNYQSNYFQKTTTNLLTKLLHFSNFYKIIQIQLVLAILLLYYQNPIILIILLIIKILISIKWNGSFNGGSDSMGIVICIGLIISTTYPSISNNINFQIAGVVYIVYNLILSYFRAGLVKIKNKNWLNGKELIIFTNNTIYNENSKIIKLINYKYNSIILSLVLILWEILFAFSILNLNLTLIFLSIGIVFHFMNFYIFGLNRFFFNWLAAYPAFIYLAILISNN
ncbi:MAG: hypothetical protein ACOVNU_11150 [Candidatus Kapaibacteriota bacterium]|jgi:hypothetical protein